MPAWVVTRHLSTASRHDIGAAMVAQGNFFDIGTALAI
jgi:hypothetical protein